MAIIPASNLFEFPTIELDANGLSALTQYFMNRRVPYLWGGKANPISQDVSTIVGLDCSGFVQCAIWHKGNHLVIPEGSVEQHEWAKAHGFEKSTFDDAHAMDGLVRIAFLSPEGGEPGHVMLIQNGSTMESHGHHGVDRRVWGSQGFMADCEIFVLTAPTV